MLASPYRYRQDSYFSHASGKLEYRVGELQEPSELLLTHQWEIKVAECDDTM